MGTRTRAEARAIWRRTMQASYDRFCEVVSMAERFGGEQPWLDDYAAKDAAEFFAVTCEAYFVNRARFAFEFPELMPLYDGFFNPGNPAALTFSVSAAPSARSAGGVRPRHRRPKPAPRRCRPPRCRPARRRGGA